MAYGLPYGSRQLSENLRRIVVACGVHRSGTFYLWIVVISNGPLGAGFALPATGCALASTHALTCNVFVRLLPLASLQPVPHYILLRYRIPPARSSPFFDSCSCSCMHGLRGTTMLLKRYGRNICLHHRQLHLFSAAHSSHAKRLYSVEIPFDRFAASYLRRTRRSLKRPR